jgi:sugar phosphate isomerase/epimerase
MATKPLLSFCSFISPDTTFEDDVELSAKWGFGGLSVGEQKLTDPALDEHRVRALSDSGLRASSCIPFNISALPVRMPGGVFSAAEDPGELLEGMCASVERLAKFKPYGVVLITGSLDGEGDDKQREVAVESLREAARVAAKHDMMVSIETIRTPGLSYVNTIPQTIQLIAAIGEPNVNIAYDVWHVWDSPDIVSLSEQYAKQIGTVHICDWLEQPAQEGDRGFAGEGVVDIPSMVAALERGGFDGWYDVEVFSSSFPSLPPEEIFRRGRESWDRTWASVAALV